MARRMDNSLNDESLNIFQAFTDLMSNAFMIISFFLFISLLKLFYMNTELRSANDKLKSAYPIIINEKSGKFKFPSGSAELTPELQKYIRTTIAIEIHNRAKGKHNIEFIQVIGHTDSQEIRNVSNLDGKITLAAKGDEKISALKAGSNADLGLMRAVAVVQLLKQIQGLEKVEFRAYSAAQLYLPSGQLASQNSNADDARRRIEIRFIPYGQKN